jgi:hypothetical protein
MASPGGLLSGGAGVGAQGGHSRGGSTGSRTETSMYEQGPASTVVAQVSYHLALRELVVWRGETIAELSRSVLLDFARGRAYIVAFDADLAPLRRPDWGLDGSTPRPHTLARLPGPHWPVQLWGPGVREQLRGTTYSGGVGLGGIGGGGGGG